MAKNRSKSKELDFNLDLDYLYELYLKQNGRCCITRVPFDLSRGDSFNQTRWNAPSLDRIEPKKGYTKGNVRFVCYQINAAMQDYGLEHFLEVCELVLENKG